MLAETSRRTRKVKLSRTPTTITTMTTFATILDSTPICRWTWSDLASFLSASVQVNSRWSVPHPRGLLE